MKPIFIFLILLVLFCNVASSQDDYVSKDSLNSLITSKDCNAYVRATTRKCKKLTKQIKSSSDRALFRYEKVEDKALVKICSINERHAESLMRHSISSFRRLEDNIHRNSSDVLNRPLKELTEVSDALIFLEHKFDGSQDSSKGKLNDCNCEGKEELKVSIDELTKELKRAECVNSYVKERSLYFNKLSFEHPELNQSIPSFEKIGYYLNARQNEYFDLFGDRGSSEKNVMKILSSISKSNSFGIVDAENQAQFSNPHIQSMEDVKKMFSQESKGKGLDMNNVLNHKGILDGDTQIKREKGTDYENTFAEDPSIEAPDTMEYSKKGISSSPNEENTDSKNKDWKRNPLKSKRFVDRFTYNFGLQPVKAGRSYPNSLSIASSISYQLTTKMNFGGGVSSILSTRIEPSAFEGKNLSFSGAMGYNFRSFYDWNFYDKLYVQVNYELNRSPKDFRTSNLLMPGEQSLSKSLLAGLKIKSPSSARSSRTFELLFDFLGRKNDQPILVVRFGVDILPKHSFKN